jgi:glycosyltransferase involved in cell wall biosynthesis
MRVAYLVADVDTRDDATRSVVAQARALAGDHDVRVLSLYRTTDTPAQPFRLDHLIDLRDPKAPKVPIDLADPKQATALHGKRSALVPAGWDRHVTALTDVALEAGLPALDVDVVVTTSPGLLAAAVELLPDRVIVVHQDYRPSTDRTPEAVLHYGPLVDVVAVPTPAVERWLHDQLGEVAPYTVVMPPPLPDGFRPRSRLDRPTIMSAGRLVPERQLPKLVAAFAEIADRIPEWRLRIVGEGPQRVDVVRQTRKANLWDRVELVRSVPDLAAEWAKASVGAISSRAEAFPLGALEAMAAGVPVVSFDAASGPRELVEHEVTGLLVGAESVSGLAAALLRMTTDAGLRQRLGEGALRASRQYAADSLAERWVGIFADARARRANRGRLGARAHARPRKAVPDPAATVEVGDVTPARARHDAMTWVAAAARAASDWWLVIPAHESPAPVVVLPMRARDAFLQALGGTDAPAYLSLREPADHGWPERRGTLARLATELRRGRSQVLSVEPWPIGVLADGCSVEVEFWEATPEGDLTSPRRNRYADRIPAGVATTDTEIEGLVVPTLPLMAEPTVSECRFPIDVVYTWVDGSDPDWNAAREQRLSGITGAAQVTAQTRESSGQARFLDRDELRYSFRSIHLFAPWVRRIHLVTAGQVPDWLDTDHPRINLVDHSEILPADGLPTFNSHAIETSLHTIEGLSEQFLYFNDDFFLARPVRPEAFFSPAGLNAVFFSPMTIGLSDRPDAPPYLKAAWNNRNLLHEAFGAVTTHNLAHAPYPHRISVLRALTEAFADVMAATARSPFRNDTDVSTLSSFAQHYGLLTGASYVGEADLAFVNLANADVDRQLELALRREQDFICLGDHHDHALRAEALERLLGEFYREYFPVAAPWERG